MDRPRLGVADVRCPPPNRGRPGRTLTSEKPNRFLGTQEVTIRSDGVVYGAIPTKRVQSPTLTAAPVVGSGPASFAPQREALAGYKPRISSICDSSTSIT
jgi:hypothetical protein